MNQPEILQSTRSVVQSLDTLKNEHTNMISTFVDKLETFKHDSQQSRHIIEKVVSLLRNSDEMVHFGISEASVLIQLSSYLQTVEVLMLEKKSMLVEIEGLRDELTYAQRKRQEAEEYSAQVEVEHDHLKFLNELKKFDETQESRSYDGESEQENSVFLNGSNGKNEKKIKLQI
jgi:hypothetical protein